MSAGSAPRSADAVAAREANATTTLAARERNTIARMCRNYAAIRKPALETELAAAWRKFANTAPFWE